MSDSSSQAAALRQRCVTLHSGNDYWVAGFLLVEAGSNVEVLPVPIQECICSNDRDEITSEHHSRYVKDCSLCQDQTGQVHRKRGTLNRFNNQWWEIT